MSSTNRGAVRVESDFYATPRSAFEPLIPFIKELGVPVWEPACGDGRLVKWMREHGIESSGTDISHLNWKKENPGIDSSDFLMTDIVFDCIVTNPPFSLAFEFCQHAVARADNVFLLLRLNFLASQARREWFQDNEPSALFVLSDRPSFVMACLCLDGSCQHRWTVPSELDRPKSCPRCDFAKIRITTSDSSDYMWSYWGNVHRGIFHL